MQADSDTCQLTRGARLEARITPKQETLFQQAARFSTRTLSEFVVVSAKKRLPIQTIQQSRSTCGSGLRARPKDIYATLRDQPALLVQCSARYRQKRTI
jgi:hypothetical protein